MFDPGGIAQLGERLDGIEKVRGSSPLASIVPPGADRHALVEPAGMLRQIYGHASKDHLVDRRTVAVDE